ncbi:MAG: type II toxin-antitoxin system death-on-curing family toxin [Acidobacteriota bacterium]
MIDIVWLDARELRAIHGELLVEHGGLPGRREEGLLESALARPKNLLAYGAPSLAELAAAYGFGLARNHPFLDGNKRIALVALAVFLDLNGYELIAPQADAVDIMLRLAASELSEAELALWIDKHLRSHRHS